MKKQRIEINRDEAEYSEEGNIIIKLRGENYLLTKGQYLAETGITDVEYNNKENLFKGTVGVKEIRISGTPSYILKDDVFINVDEISDYNLELIGFIDAKYFDGISRDGWVNEKLNCFLQHDDGNTHYRIERLGKNKNTLFYGRIESMKEFKYILDLVK